MIIKIYRYVFPESTPQLIINVDVIITAIFYLFIGIQTYKCLFTNPCASNRLPSSNSPRAIWQFDSPMPQTDKSPQPFDNGHQLLVSRDCHASSSPPLIVFRHARHVNVHTHPRCAFVRAAVNEQQHPRPSRCPRTTATSAVWLEHTHTHRRRVIRFASSRQCWRRVEADWDKTRRDKLRGNSMLASMWPLPHAANASPMPHTSHSYMR